jgi:hypothetical protein
VSPVGFYLSVMFVLSIEDDYIHSVRAKRQFAINNGMQNTRWYFILSRRTPTGLLKKISRFSKSLSTRGTFQWQFQTTKYRSTATELDQNGELWNTAAYLTTDEKDGRARKCVPPTCLFSTERMSEKRSIS